MPTRISLVLAAGLVGLTGCAPARPAPLPAFAVSYPCHAVIDEAGVTATSIAWREMTAGASGRANAIGCATVGPAVYSAPPVAPLAPSDRIVIASWNVHVGGGDLAAFVAGLRRGDLTGGAPVADFVVLVQEALRGGGAVPERVPRGISVPARIDARGETGDPVDIVGAARTLGLGVFYVPSMRNGAAGGDRSEDRGNAILSTRPLTDLMAIALPFERQRRVAVAGTIGGVDSDGRAWQLRVVSSHLNGGSSARRLWLLSTAARDRQAEALAAALADDDLATIVGCDLNSWAGGVHEPAYRTLRRAFPKTPRSAWAQYRHGLILDYMFLRVPDSWAHDTRAVDDRFGSDHRPLVTVVTLRES
jgi:endonuclease/exonuclease/phosphatase family metal-dependent hydrolase